MQLINCKSPELIARFHSLQTIVLHTGYENDKPQEAVVSNEILGLTEELAKSLLTGVERIEVQQFKEYNPSLEYKLQAEAFRAVRAARGKRHIEDANAQQEKKLFYESRILTAIAALCRKYTSIANALMDTEWTIEMGATDDETSGTFTGTFVFFLIETLNVISRAVGAFDGRSCGGMF